MKKENIQIISLAAAPKFLDYSSTQIKNLQDQARKVEKYILVNFQKTNYKVEKKENILFIEVPRIKTLFYINKIVKEIKKELDSEKKSVITAGNPFDLAIIGIILKTILKLPLQLQIHMDLFSKYFLKSKKRHYPYFLLSKLTIPLANSIRTVSTNTESILRKKYPKKNIKNIIEIADFSDFKINTEKNKEGLLYLCPARYDEQKNLFNLIEAFINFHEKIKNIRLKIIGSGHLENNLRKFITENKAEEYIKLPGWSKNMPNEYTKANFSILTSLFEGYGMVVIESLHYGTPFLATPFTGGTTLIKNKINGFVATGFTKEDILDLLIKSYENRNIFNSKTIKDSVKELTKDSMDENLIEFWLETI